ncbi:MAG: imelysin family protein, partial [Cyclobacteriaceae bacterium]
IIDGVGIDEVVAIVDSQLNEEMEALLAASSASVNVIQAPFDQEILGVDTDPGRIRVRTAIDALRAQGDKLAEIAAELGYSLDPDDI